MLSRTRGLFALLLLGVEAVENRPFPLAVLRAPETEIKRGQLDVRLRPCGIVVDHFFEIFDGGFYLPLSPLEPRPFVARQVRTRVEFESAREVLLCAVEIALGVQNGPKTQL